MSHNDNKEATKVLSELRNNLSQSLIIHYSRQDLMDNESGISTPRIIAIMIKSLDGTMNDCFAIHHEAEKARVIPEQIVDYYDQLEERLLHSFNEFVKKYKNCRWIHWGMNDVHFGFEAITHRYRVLIGDTGADDLEEIARSNRVDINWLLIKTYGDSYEAEPVFENLMKSNNNGVCKPGYLTMEDEAKAFRNLQFPSILESLVCKVNFLATVIDKTNSQTLLVSNSTSTKKKRHSSEDSPIISLLKNVYFWPALVILLSGAFSLGFSFGGSKFDKEKMEYYNQNIKLNSTNDSLIKEIKALKIQLDTIKK